jgi:hypothetical protein
VTRGALAAEQPRSAEHQRSGADRGDELGIPGEPAHLVQDFLVADRIIGGAEPSGNADHVTARDVSKPGNSGKGEAVGGFEDAAGPACHEHLGAGEPGEHLVRAGKVELGDARIEREHDGDRRAVHRLPLIV